jgi:putative methionine-R-sulfoxide reductase with GAF domain
VPRKINILCDNALHIGYGLQKRLVSAAIVEEAVNDLSQSFFPDRTLSLEPAPPKDRALQPEKVIPQTTQVTTAPPSTPKLHIVGGAMKGRSFFLHDGTVFVGRSPSNDIQIKHDAGVSRKHLKILKVDGRYYIEDLKSTNGTFIDGEQVMPGEAFEIVEGATISIGNTDMCLTQKPPAIEPKKYEEEGLSGERRERSSKDLGLLYEITELLRQSLSLRNFLDKVIALLFDTLPRIDRAAIVLYDEEEGKIMDMVAQSKNEVKSAAVSYGRTIMNRVMQNGTAVQMSDSDDDVNPFLSDGMNTLVIRSVLCVPVISNSKTHGAIYVDSLRGAHGFRKEDKTLLNNVSGAVAVAIENAKLTSHLK